MSIIVLDSVQCANFKMPEYGLAIFKPNVPLSNEVD